jgi:hypothetical protein
VLPAPVNPRDFSGLGKQGTLQTSRKSTSLLTVQSVPEKSSEKMYSSKCQGDTSKKQDQVEIFSIEMPARPPVGGNRAAPVTPANRTTTDPAWMHTSRGSFFLTAFSPRLNPFVPFPLIACPGPTSQNTKGNTTLVHPMTEAI